MVDLEFSVKLRSRMLSEVVLLEDLIVRCRRDFCAFCIKPWPNEGNIAIQHRSTLLSATCRTRLATMLYHVARCCIMLSEV